MQKIRFFFVFVLLFSGLASKAQDNEVILQYINTYNEMAIAEMQRTGVPASIKLAQGIHETMAGTSDLVKQSNNHFGIKCKAEWKGESVTHDDDRRGECFRKYENSIDSYKDHSNFLRGSNRYASLFDLDPLDYRDWAYGLKKAGYATNPRYPQVIIKLIEDYHLQDYTLVALGKLSREEMIAKNPAIMNKPKNELVADAMRRAEEATIAVVQKTEVIIEEEPDYPSGEFRINDTRVTYARRDVSVLTIAQQYNVPLAKIFEFNEMKETEVLEKGQLIYLQRKRKTGNNQFHIVKPGETLRDIARTEAIRLESLLEYNYLNASTRPAAGEQLYLHKKAPGMPKLETRIASANPGIVE
jgi:LysM repeat protein